MDRLVQQPQAYMIGFMKMQWMTRAVPITLLALSVQFAVAKDISFNDLPAAAKRVADTEVKTATLKRVESVKHQGRDIYALTFQKADGTAKYIYLNPDGTYVRDVPASPSWGSPTTIPTVGKDVDLSKLPEAVQKTIQTETKNGPVSRVTEVPQKGKPIYEIAFRQANGQEKVIYLNPDGSYAQSRSWDALGSTPAAGLTTLTAPKAVNFAELPTPVQNAFRAQAGASRVEHLQSGQLNGQPVYQGQITRNGQKMQVRVDANGKVLNTGLTK